MPKKVRVFISCTMNDLANERQEIVHQIEKVNRGQAYYIKFKYWLKCKGVH